MRVSTLTVFVEAVVFSQGVLIPLVAAAVEGHCQP